MGSDGVGGILGDGQESPLRVVAFKLVFQYQEDIVELCLEKIWGKRM